MASGYFASTWNGRHEIVKSVAMVATDRHSGVQLRSVVLEEMVQSLGPGTDQSIVKNSIFYETSTDSGFADHLSVFDRNLLRVLYQDLQPGADKTQVEVAFERFF